MILIRKNFSFKISSGHIEGSFIEPSKNFDQKPKNH